MNIPPEVLAMMRLVASRKTAREMYFEELEKDQYAVPAWCETGNYDDSYEMGCEDGSIELARTILAGLKA